jgi:formate hydrogenlyase subunit 4
MTTGEAIALGAVQTGVLIGVAPLVNGCIRKIKARFQMRRGPALLQDYWNIWKWIARSEQTPDGASFVSAIAPWGILAAIIAASLFVPVFSAHSPVRSAGDLFVLIALLALARALLTLAGMDSGSALGQMGCLPDIVAFGDRKAEDFITLGWGLAIVGFVVVVVAETGRIPVDNPDTHLELTMVHEGMLIEFSGRSLGTSRTCSSKQCCWRYSRTCSSRSVWQAEMALQSTRSSSRWLYSRWPWLPRGLQWSNRSSPRCASSNCRTLLALPASPRCWVRLSW